MYTNIALPPHNKLDTELWLSNWKFLLGCRIHVQKNVLSCIGSTKKKTASCRLGKEFFIPTNATNKGDWCSFRPCLLSWARYKELSSQHPPFTSNRKDLLWGQRAGASTLRLQRHLSTWPHPVSLEHLVNVLNQEFLWLHCKPWPAAQSSNHL